MSKAGGGPEERLLNRTRWVLTGQIGAVITGVVLLVGVVALALMISGQHTDGRRELAGSIRTSSIEHPWPCVWMFQRQGGTVTRTPAAPAALPVRSDLDAVAASGKTVVTSHRAGGVDYLVRTQMRGGTVVQAALDLRYQAEERQRLYVALAVAEAAGLLAALVTGGVLARRAIRPLGEALRRQRWFVADASHELRTPLTQIHTRAQLLARRLSGHADGLEPAEWKRLATEADRLVAGTRQFGEVIDDLLLSAQLGREAQKLDPVNLSAVVTEVLAAEHARAECRGLTLALAVRGAGPYLVAGVAPALRRVVNALVDNAIGHTPPGGSITVGLRRLADHGGTVELTVSDDGVGLRPGDAQRIFERFARGEQGAGRRFGLGLALVREVLDSHGGSITADGEPGRGAVFTIRLPALPDAAGPDRGDGPGPQWDEARPASSRRVTSAT